MRNRAIGLNFIDTYYRSGLYPAPGLPSGLGSEGAGEVEAVGSEATRFKVGDRVAYATGPLGAYSELHVLAEEKLVHLPNGIDFEQAAAVMPQGLTTQYLLRQTYELRGGETILFHAAAGGVGPVRLPMGQAPWSAADRHRQLAGKGAPGQAARCLGDHRL